MAILRRLNILAIHRYYLPDTPPYASILNSIVQHWAKDGHDVEVLSSLPSYKKGHEQKYKKILARERIQGVVIRRIRLPNEIGKPFMRILNAIHLACAILLKVVYKKYDIIMISTSPPVIGAWVVALAAKIRKSRFIYHCMDIHPEIGRISGEFSNPMVYKILQSMDHYACRSASPVVVLSTDMEQSLKERSQSIAPIKTKVINNFSLPHDRPCANSKYLSGEKTNNNLFTILFAGNIGRFQGLDTVIDAMAMLEDEPIEFVFMGEGEAKEGLIIKANKCANNVRFVGHQSVEIAKKAMKESDICFVSLIPNIIRYAYPSKTMAYLEQGCPVIAAVELDSELAVDINRNGYGFVVPPGDYVELANLLRNISSNKDWQVSMREAAYIKYESTYREDIVLPGWSDLLYQEVL